eukprot:144243_1
MVYIRDYPFDIWSSLIEPVCEWSLNYIPKPGVISANKITLSGVYMMLICCALYVYTLNSTKNDTINIGITQHTYINICYGFAAFFWMLTDGLDGMYARHYNTCSIGGEFLDHSADRILFAFVEIITLIITGVETKYMLPILAALFWFMHYTKCCRQFYYGEMAIDSSGTWFRVLAAIVPLIFALSNVSTHFVLVAKFLSKHGWIIFMFINMRQMMFLLSTKHKNETQMLTLFSQRDLLLGMLYSFIYIIVVTSIDACDADCIMIILCQSCVGAMIKQFLLVKILKDQMKPSVNRQLMNNWEVFIILIALVLCYFIADSVVDTIRLYFVWFGLVCLWFVSYVYYFYVLTQYNVTDGAHVKKAEQNVVKT